MILSQLTFMELISLLKDLHHKSALGMSDEDRKELSNAVAKEIKTRYPTS